MTGRLYIRVHYDTKLSLIYVKLIVTYTEACKNLQKVQRNLKIRKMSDNEQNH